MISFYAENPILVAVWMWLKLQQVPHNPPAHRQQLCLLDRPLSLMSVCRNAGSFSTLLPYPCSAARNTMSRKAQGWVFVNRCSRGCPE